GSQRPDLLEHDRRVAELAAFGEELRDVHADRESLVLAVAAGPDALGEAVAVPVERPAPQALAAGRSACVRHLDDRELRAVLRSGPFDDRDLEAGGGGDGTGD